MDFDDWPGLDDIGRRCLELCRLMSEAPREALAALVEFADGLDEDRLCQVGVFVVEPLVDVHFADIGAEFEERLRHSASLRKALSYAWLSIDAEIQAQLRRLIPPEDDIGHRQQAEKPPRPNWRPVAIG